MGHRTFPQTLLFRTRMRLCGCAHALVQKGLGTRLYSGMSMRLKKVCPQCDATLHARKLACPCGHVFPAKAQQTKPIENRQSDNVRKAARKACETGEETRKRQAQNQERMASLRLHCSVSIATHQIAEWRTCANQITPRVLHFSALVTAFLRPVISARV